jgi:acetyl esterase/lipase
MKWSVTTLLLAVLTTAGPTSAQSGAGHAASGTHVVHADVAYGDHDRQVMDIYLARDAGRTGHRNFTIVFLHGGGFSFGDKSITGRYVTPFLHEGMNVVNMTYRIRQGIHVATEDLTNALNHLARHNDQYALDLSNVIVGGFSAGAAIASTVGFSRHDPAYPYPLAEGIRITGILNFSGPVDHLDEIVEIFRNSDDESWQLVGRNLFLPDPRFGREEMIETFTPFTWFNDDAPAYFLSHGGLDDQVPARFFNRFIDALTASPVYHRIVYYPEAGHSKGPQELDETFVELFRFLDGMPAAAAQSQGVPGARLFDPGRVLQVEIRMSPEDWQEVRLSHRDGNDPMLASIGEDGAYEYRPAEVWIDGVHAGRVGVRKKGFFGSVISTRPSLRVKFGEYEPGLTFEGLDGLTLNNNNQDASLVHQIMAYDMFARAGVPAPRASFARVRVNGEDLGIYTNVERIGPAFLRRVFGASSGALFEGYVGDFALNLARIADKRGPVVAHRHRLERLEQLLAMEGPVALDEIEELVELDAFIRMWAMESLIGHWDGYTGNRNNYYLYVHHETGRLNFIPWGADAIFADPGPLQTKVVPKSFKAEGLLAQRLWEIPAIRARYHAAMREFLAGPWSEQRLIDRMTELQALAQPQSTMRLETVQRVSETWHAFINGRREQVEAELHEPAPTWPASAPPALPVEGYVEVSLSGAFSAPWLPTRPDDPLAIGEGTLQVEVTDSAVIAVQRVGAFATTYEQPHFREGYHVVVVNGVSGTRQWTVSLVIDPFLLQPGRLPIDHFEARAILTIADEGGSRRTRGFGLVGELHLDEIDPVGSGIVSGRFTIRGATP